MVCNHVVILTNCVQIMIYNETMIVTLIMLVIALMLRTMLLQTLMMLMVVFADFDDANGGVCRLPDGVLLCPAVCRGPMSTLPPSYVPVSDPLAPTLRR